MNKGVTAFCIISMLLILTACVHDDELRKPINMEGLEGAWRGEALSQPESGYTVCNLDFAIGFIVRNGRLFSKLYTNFPFDVPIRLDGYVEFAMEDAVTSTGDFLQERKEDIVFRGWLDDSGRAEGRFRAGQCGGAWHASRVAVPD